MIGNWKATLMVVALIGLVSESGLCEGGNALSARPQGGSVHSLTKRGVSCRPPSETADPAFLLPVQGGGSCAGCSWGDWIAQFGGIAGGSPISCCGGGDCVGCNGWRTAYLFSCTDEGQTCGTGWGPSTCYYGVWYEDDCCTCAVTTCCFNPACCGIIPGPCLECVECTIRYPDPNLGGSEPSLVPLDTCSRDCCPIQG